MKVVLDTNVFVSGLFFSSGAPRQILLGWNEGRFKLVVSLEIFKEYQVTIQELRRKYHSIDVDETLDLVLREAEICSSFALPQAVCDDPKDDMFFACALAAKAKIIVSGDKHLLSVKDYEGIEVLKPRSFFEKYLQR